MKYEVIKQTYSTLINEGDKHIAQIISFYPETNENVATRLIDKLNAHEELLVRFKAVNQELCERLCFHRSISENDTAHTVRCTKDTALINTIEQGQANG